MKKKNFSTYLSTVIYNLYKHHVGIASIAGEEIEVKNRKGSGKMA